METRDAKLVEVGQEKLLSGLIQRRKSGVSFNEMTRRILVDRYLLNDTIRMIIMMLMVKWAAINEIGWLQRRAPRLSAPKPCTRFNPFGRLAQFSFLSPSSIGLIEISATYLIPMYFSRLT